MAGRINPLFAAQMFAPPANPNAANPDSWRSQLPGTLPNGHLMPTGQNMPVVNGNEMSGDRNNIAPQPGQPDQLQMTQYYVPARANAAPPDYAAAFQDWMRRYRT